MLSCTFGCVCFAVAGIELANFIRDVEWEEKDEAWDLTAATVFEKSDIKVSLVYQVLQCASLFCTGVEVTW